MALTDAQKRKIEEEEAYRQQLQGEDAYRKQLHEKPHKKSLSIGKIILVIVLAPFILAIILISFTSSSNKTSNSSDTLTTEITSQTGSYVSFDGNTYKYDIGSQQKEGKDMHSATFEPFLPQNDKNILEAAFKAMQVTYGDKVQVNPEPSLVDKNGVKVLKFTSDYGDYFVMPIKEDTGEVHSIVFWYE